MSIVSSSCWAFADQWQRSGIVLAMAEGKSRPIADGGFFHARHGSVAAKNFAQQHCFLRGGAVNVRTWDRWDPAARSEWP